ncbi:unnamed protein product [marine sediment metagenome]|uniref:Uncharacterized protein n=1 Tax=marine sediment metagenome TaxID=412755 RepID=X1V0C0_9ZZZZ
MKNIQQMKQEMREDHERLQAEADFDSLFDPVDSVECVDSVDS